MRFLLSAFRWRYFAIASLQVCSVLFDIHAGGGERKIHTVGLHDVHNVQVQVVLHLQKFRVGVSAACAMEPAFSIWICRSCSWADRAAFSARSRSSLCLSARMISTNSVRRMCRSSRSGIMIDFSRKKWSDWANENFRQIRKFSHHKTTFDISVFGATAPV